MCMIMLMDDYANEVLVVKRAVKDEVIPSEWAGKHTEQ